MSDLKPFPRTATKYSWNDEISGVNTLATTNFNNTSLKRKHELTYHKQIIKNLIINTTLNF